jgi:hypothetical protein
MKRLLWMTAFATLLIVTNPATRVLAQNADPLSGTWELDLAKSKFSGPAPKSQTRTYDVAGDSVKLTSKGVSADGHPTAVQFNARFDGKDYPITGLPNADTIALERIDAFRATSTLKKNGKVAITSTRTIAKDGKTMTIKSKGTDAKGEKIDDVLVFVKR